MSDYEQKNGTGTIWKNKDFEQGGNKPYAKGRVKLLDGTEVDMALWIPKSEKVTGFNLTMQEPYVKQEQTESISQPKSDDLPF